MNNILKGVMLAAATCVTVIVISLTFFYSRENKEINNNVKLAEVLENYSPELAKSIYNGMPVTGTEVIEVLKEFSSDYTLGVRVINKYSDKYYGASFSANGDGTYSFDNPNTAGSYSLSYTVENDEYINPIDEFTGSVQFDANGDLIGITFFINVI